MNEKKPGYWAIITAAVRYDDSLPANAKLLFGEITALADRHGYCWASNEYFADLYGVSKTSVSKWISALVESGHIAHEIIYKGGTREIDKRSLTIVIHPIEEKLKAPIEEKLKENTTIYNTTMNTTNNNLPKIKFSATKEFRVIFESIYLELKNVPYYWTAKDAGQCESLYNKLKFLINEKNKEKGFEQKESETQQLVKDSFIHLMRNIKDPWVLDNLSMAIFNSKFNEIVQKVRGAHSKKSTHDQIDNALNELLSEQNNG